MTLRIRIAGKGSQEKELKELADELNIANCIEWLGFVDISCVPSIWQSLDVAVIPSESESESFGVSAVEAQACGLPVIISDIPGLMEATCPDARVVVPRGDASAIADALIKLYHEPKRRHAMGAAGRKFVEEYLALAPCFEHIEGIYARNMGILHG